MHVMSCTGAASVCAEPHAEVLPGLLVQVPGPGHMRPEAKLCMAACQQVMAVAHVGRGLST